ncbi:hypothetical protein PRZ48_013584 [Zasmidium cellare]|uniref:F-box domain-containing protein n=1 Tax=Zasmidium cellare TaxID=395010 RepID=A0ABR0E1F4_ZASCE|nr:hypothetical protein PRZ48_013584 [Zasmidium cellare]
MPSEETALAEQLQGAHLTENHGSHTDGNIPAEKPDLSNIAQEIFDFIAAEVDLEDLRNLRLVSRSINSKALETYTREHFADYSLLLCNRESLESAIEVARHPVFGPAIEKITVFVDELRIDTGAESCCDGDWYFKPCSRREDVLKYRFIEEACLESVNELFDALMDQATLRTSAEDRKLLTEVFSLLETNAQVQEVNIDVCTVFEEEEEEEEEEEADDDNDKPFCTTKPWRRNLRTDRNFRRHEVKTKSRNFEVFFGFRPPGFDYDDWNGSAENAYPPFSIIMQALSQSTLRPKSLAIGQNGVGWDLCLNKLNQDSRTQRACKKVFADLEHLSMNISRPMRRPRENLYDDRARMFAGLLEASPNLVSLAVSTHRSGDGLHDVVRKVASPNLRTLRLSDLRAELPDFLTTIRAVIQLNPLLCRLDLKSVTLRDCRGPIDESVMEDSDASDDDGCAYGKATSTNLVGRSLQEVLGLSGEYDRSLDEERSSPEYMSNRAHEGSRNDQEKDESDVMLGDLPGQSRKSW